MDPLLHSVLTCLLKCTNDWYLNIENGKYTSVTSITLRNAFDTGNHEILVKSCKAMESGAKSYSGLNLTFLIGNSAVR